MRLPGVAGASENAFSVALESQGRSKLPPEMPSVSLRSPKCTRRACSGAACALETAACASPKAARSLEKLVRASSATALLSNYCSKVLHEVTDRSHVCLCNAVLTPTSRSSACKVHGMHGSTLVYIYIHVWSGGPCGHEPLRVANTLLNSSH